ncbi:MAG: hypothetical protein ACP5T6_01620 [Candidatus Micrarchaeia archaeon]
MKSTANNNNKNNKVVTTLLQSIIKIDTSKNPNAVANEIISDLVGQLNEGNEVIIKDVLKNLYVTVVLDLEKRIYDFYFDIANNSNIINFLDSIGKVHNNDVKNRTYNELLKNFKAQFEFFYIFLDYFNEIRMNNKLKNKDLESNKNTQESSLTSKLNILLYINLKYFRNLIQYQFFNSIYTLKNESTDEKVFDINDIYEFLVKANSFIDEILKSFKNEKKIEIKEKLRKEEDNTIYIETLNQFIKLSSNIDSIITELEPQIKENNDFKWFNKFMFALYSISIKNVDASAEGKDISNALFSIFNEIKEEFGIDESNLKTDNYIS